MLAVAAGLALLAAAYPRAQAQDPGILQVQPKPARKILYLMPNWLYFRSSSDATIAAETSQLRARFGEGRYVRVGFNLYIFISMESWEVDTANPAAVRAELTSTIAQIDDAIGKAQRANVPISLSLLTAIRERTDPAQAASQRADRRNMQWYQDNGLATGWWSFSRYARRQRVVLQAYMQELAKVIANRMAKYPALVVAATGDGEVEMSRDRAGPPAVIADYSPFAIKEFADWLRAAGLYAPGQPYAGQAYEHASRYAGDASPAVDTNGDGRTLNNDFGTNFTSWSLRYFDWSLDDDIRGDPRTIPATTYEGSGWNPFPDAGAGLFDAPRHAQDTAWWSVWTLFRHTMVQHYNADFARWMTSTPDPETGLAIPAERWYSDQIPTDYLFGHPPPDGGHRLTTSASPWWTAYVAPHGALGITSFNVYANGFLFPTLRNVAPVIAQQNVRWGIIEYHASVPIAPNLEFYRQDMDVIERYKPGLVIPIYWGDPYYQIQNTPFEVALRELVTRIKDNPSFGESPVDLSSPPLPLPEQPGPGVRFPGSAEIDRLLRDRKLPPEERGLRDRKDPRWIGKPPGAGGSGAGAGQ